MNKLTLTVVGLALAALSASAQENHVVIDYNSWDHFNKVEISKDDRRVETSVDFAFPMYFGTSVLRDVNYLNEWAVAEKSCPDFLDLDTRKNFVYALELASVHFRSRVVDLSLGLRWSFMNFTFSNPDFTLRRGADKVFYPYPIKLESASYDNTKSKLFASYLGIPVRLNLHYGKATVYAGASAELLLDAYTKYRQPKVRQTATGAFNDFRATVEAGVSFYNVGFFVNYGITPLFKGALSDAHTITFGLTLGL